MCNDLSKVHGDGVAELSHRLRPDAGEHIVIGKRLEASAFADREVPNGTVRVRQHVLAAGYSVDACLEGLRGLVEGAARVARIGSGPGLKDVVGHLARCRIPRVRQSIQSIANGRPGEEFILLLEQTPLDLRLDPRRRIWAILPRDLVPVPIVARNPLVPKQ